jgi:hypothetical protein
MREQIFVSYSHQDKKFLAEFKKMLAPVASTLDLWDDSRIAPGADWEGEIKQALARAKVAVLLVSDDFLASDFIIRHELPPLLDAAKSDGLTVFWVYLSPCLYQHTEIARFQAAHDLSKALDELSLAKRRAMLREICQKLIEIAPLGGAALKPLAGEGRARADLARLPNRHDNGVFVGREAYWQRLEQAWQDPHTRIVALIAIGGAGKTTLAGRWARALAGRQEGGLAAAYGWTFYSQGSGERRQASADYFIRDALRFFGDPELAEAKATAWDKGSRLAELVARQKTLLVLDGLEPLQYSPGPLAGSLTDEGLRALFAGLALRNPGLCLITSRETIEDLRTYETAAQWPLDRLDEAAGTEVLRRHGVAGQDAELAQAVREVKGHALTLALMGRYLKLAYDPPDIARRDCFKFEDADKETANGHAFRVYAAYERWLAGPPARQTFWQRLFRRRPKPDGDQTAVELLRLLGLFDRAANPGCLAALRQKPAIPGLTDALAGAGDAQWNSAVSRLETLGLVEKTAWEDLPVYGYGEEDAQAVWKAGMRYWHQLGEPRRFPPARAHSFSFHQALDAHPLLREYFAGQLAREQPEAWREAHARLYETLSASVPYWPEGADGLAALYQAVVHGCRAGRHEEARAKVYRDRIQRGTDGSQAFYASKKLGLFGPDLAAVACFFAELWSRPMSDLPAAAQAWILNAAAMFLRALNRLAEARAPMRAGLEMYVKQEDWTNAANAATNLSALELLLGELSAAQATAAQAVDYAGRGGDAFWRMASRAYHADALHQAGQAQAQERFAEAESLQKERQPDYPLLYALQGYWYCDCLLGVLERAASRAYQGCGGSTPLCPATAIGQEAKFDKSSGIETPHAGPLAEIERRATLTLEIAIEQFGPLEIGLDHLSLGRVQLYRVLLDLAPGPPPAETRLRQAQTHLDTALAKVRESGYQEHIRALLPRAWLHALQGEWAQAQSRLDEAHAIATRGGAGATMRLHLADVHLYRARLFGVVAAPAYPQAWISPEADLAEARRLIEACGYGRRVEELADLEQALRISSA